MKTKNLQIVIDLKDLYPEFTQEGGYEEGYYRDYSDVNTAIKDEIQREVLEKIIKGFSPELVQKLKDEMLQKFGDQFHEKINARICRVIEHGIFSDKSTFNINNFVKQRLEMASTNSNFLAQLDKVIKNRLDVMQKTLQDRYDMEFASMIIKNLKDGGLLKDGAEKMLIKD